MLSDRTAMATKGLLSARTSARNISGPLCLRVVVLAYHSVLFPPDTLYGHVPTKIAKHRRRKTFESWEDWYRD